MRALIKVGFSLLLLAFVLIGLSYSMLRAKGSSGANNPEGRVVSTETRGIGKNITTIDLSGPIDLTLRQGAASSLSVRGEQRLLGNVETVQDGATLHIATKGMLLYHRHPLQAVLVLPSVEKISIHGSGDSTINGFSGERIELQLHGSGDVKFSGRFKHVSARLNGSGDMEINVGNSDSVEVALAGSGEMVVVGATRQLKAEQSGSGDLTARHLAAGQAALVQHGSGSARIQATRSASVTLYGSGDAVVHGNPAERNVTRNGSGEVKFRE
ncbi:MAG: DUF2807 domain-containing protein [Telluria sp.]|nr:DUF2807 domain-containing protein [Telluria sp.]